MNFSVLDEFIFKGILKASVKIGELSMFWKACINVGMHWYVDGTLL